MNATVVRRFDLRVDEAKALGDVRDWLLALIQKESGELPTASVKPLGRLSRLEVRLEGSPAAVSRVVAHMADRPGLRIQRDSVSRVAARDAGAHNIQTPALCSGLASSPDWSATHPPRGDVNHGNGSGHGRHRRFRHHGHAPKPGTPSVEGHH